MAVNKMKKKNTFGTKNLSAMVLVPTGVSKGFTFPNFCPTEDFVFFHLTSLTDRREVAKSHLILGQKMMYFITLPTYLAHLKTFWHQQSPVTSQGETSSITVPVSNSSHEISVIASS